MANLIRVLICGTGGGAHVLAGVISTKPGVHVRVLSMTTERAESFTKVMPREGLKISTQNGKGEARAWTTNHFTVEGDPEAAARDADIIFFVLPAYLHSSYLT